MSKNTTKPAPKTATPATEYSPALRAPQVRILKLLAGDKAYTRAQIAAKAEVDNAFCTTWIGSLDESSRKANEKKRGIPSLLGLKYVKAEQHDVNGKDTILYFITAAGKAALAKAK